MIKAFQYVLGKSEGSVPVYLQTDKGKEFITQSMQKFFKENNIRFWITSNLDIKAAIVERFNRTLKERMWRYFTHKSLRRYIDVLQDIVFAYNHTRHSSTRMQPAIITRENPYIARENIACRWKNEMLKKHTRKVNTALEISFVSVERKALSRKDTRLNGVKRYFKFIVFSIGETLTCMNCEI